MGLFSLFFKKKHNQGIKITTSPVIANKPIPTSEVSPLPNSSKRGIADENGLYPTELLMLYIAEKFYVNGDKFPTYLRNDFQIGYPKEILTHLHECGFIRKPDISESLMKLKSTELQDIATNFDIALSGKKVNMVSKLIENVDADLLRAFIPDGKWIITDRGHKAMELNPYVNFFVEKHLYHPSAVNIDIWKVNKLVHQHPQMLYRDLIFSELNQQQLLAYEKGVKKRQFSDYCQYTRAMALFADEEKKHPLTAATMYLEYLFYRINFKNVISYINYIKGVSVSSKLREDPEYLNMECYLLDWELNEIAHLREAINYTPEQFYRLMVEQFEKARDTSAFNAKQLADYVSHSIVRDKEATLKICREVSKTIVKQLKR